MRRVRKTIGDKSIGSKSILIFLGEWGVYRGEKAWRDK